MDLDLEAALRILIAGLVDKPAEVRIDASITDHSAHFEVQVADDEVGKILGKKGIYANSMRRLFGAAYANTGRSFNLAIVDPRRRGHPRGS